MSSKILIVEDEADIRELISLHLTRAGYLVDEAADGLAALQKMSHTEYSLLLLDWMLPEVNGLDLLKKVKGDRSKERTPVLMLTAKATASDIVMGLETGADDYLTKPFEPAVLSARVKALLRRATTPVGFHTNQKIVLGDLVIDSELHQVTLLGKELVLTPSEFKLLHALASNRGRVLTRDKLIELVQGSGVAVIDRAIDTHVFGLRKKLGEAADFIETVRGIGYRISYGI